MRILLVTDWLRIRGGVEGFIVWLRDALRAAGDDARLLTSSAGSAADGTADYVVYGANRATAQLFLQIVNPSAVVRANAAIRNFHPEVVHVHMFENHLSPAIRLGFGETPIVLSIADYKMICPTNSKLLPDGSLCRIHAGSVCVRQGCVNIAHWLRDRPRYWLIHRWPARVGRVLACSTWLQRELSDHGIASEAFPLPARLPPLSFRRMPSAAPLFVYCGRLVREKGLELLVRAFAALRRSVPKAELRVIGDGPLSVPLRHLAESLAVADAVTFLGWLSPEDLEPELARAWAVVAPSLWAEPFGLVALEAVVRGVPVIASAAGGFLETVKPCVTGLLFPSGNEASLLACLEAVAQRQAFPSLVTDAAEVQHARETWSPEAYLTRLRGIYQSLVGPKGAKA